ncbi:far upstream element-binding protein 1 isoform X2 [Prorops nasuta]|uniref:far upstream element-binding protein 1 isoform X2 n=1 Tax=Prorops nasuta TaxID=863751 RepID=UPI0034CD452D
MSDYSAVAPPQNFSQSSAFAAALQRAKQIAAKINPGGAQNSQDSKLKRPAEDSTEPEAKKMAAMVADPLMGLRTGPAGNSSLGDNPLGSRIGGQATSPPPIGGIGSICNEDIRVPDKMVGLIIGRGGEQITRLQSETGCKIQMAPESGGLPERVCTLTGSREAVNRAKELVLSIVNQRSRTEGVGELNISNTGSGMIGHPGFVEIMIPGPKVGLIIGKGGETIKQLQEKSGAKMVVIQEGPSQEQEKPLRITGDPQKVEYAKQLVYELIAEKEMQMFQRVSRAGDRSGSYSSEGGFSHGSANNDGVERRDDGRNNAGGGRGGPRGNGFSGNRNPNEYGGGWDRRAQGGPMQDKVEITFTVPSSKCGIIIGKGGETIKQINQQTGAHCELDRRNQSNENEKIFIIRGNPEQVEHAKRIFSEKLGMGPAGGAFPGGQNTIGYNPNWNAGAGYQAWPNQAQTNDAGNANQASIQVNPQTGQPDYSAQWAEYYRSLGMHREADMIEQQSKQGKPDHNQGGNAQSQSNSTSVCITGPGQQPQPQQQQQQGASQNGGQADYSAQWAEYYRSIGKIKEAEAIEAQMKAGKLGMQNNQIQPQLQQNMQGQGTGPPGGGTPNSFPQAYGNYPGMNTGSNPGAYYASGAGSTNPQQSAQQNPSFPSGYQNYSYPQPNSDN